MELNPVKKLKIFSGRSHTALAEEIADCLGVPLGSANLKTFPNGEIKCQFTENIRGSDVFIIQSHCGEINASIMENMILLDAAKRASAKRITAVLPYYGYARQDRKAAGREPITAKLVADMLTVAGADRIMTIDLHSGQIQGFFDGPFDHLVAMPVLLDYIRNNAPGDVVVCAPDAGGVKLADRYARHLGADLVFVQKRRDTKGDGAVEAIDMVGEVDGRCCVLIDDMIDTAGTITAAAELLSKRGATEVWVAATHLILSDPATERLKNSSIARVVGTNTIPLPPERQLPIIEQLSVAPLIAEVISAVFEDQSVSEIFGGENQS
ncbi:MAG TPA: ribose-phosphate diphosphokinase [Acidimicrobiales bacterium]|nr:ribose-phosphate diphosphokinase [Acidimicrobiales bacterium]